MSKQKRKPVIDPEGRWFPLAFLVALFITMYIASCTIEVILPCDLKSEEERIQQCR